MRGRVRCNVWGFCLFPSFWRISGSKLSVSTSCDLGDMVERVLTVMATPLGSRDVRPPLLDDNLLVLTMFYSSPSPRNILLCVMCTYQLKPRSPPHPGPSWEYVGIVLWYLKAWPTRGDGGFLRFCFAYWSKSGSEVGICLVPSLLLAVSSRHYWYFDDCSAVRRCFRVWLRVTTPAARLSCFSFKVLAFKKKRT